MSNIPVVVLGIKRANNKAVATAKHLRKVGFKNVSIYYGIDLKKDTNKIIFNTFYSILHLFNINSRIFR